VPPAALHGALQAGALATTFTASQGLLLMLPNMYKIAGELTPAVIHVAARSLAAQALSIFGDHSDVMSVRMTGFAMLASNSVQEAQDMAAVAHIATLESRIPFLHFFDGFRTSHEVAKITAVEREELKALLDERFVHEHRARGLSPDRPVMRGTAQNPDVYFQGRETVNPWVNACPAIVSDVMERFAKPSRAGTTTSSSITGDPEATDLVVIMGSGSQTVEAAVEALRAQGRKVGCLTVRLFRPFDLKGFMACVPATVERIAVLDRVKEPGAPGDPLYLDVRAVLDEAFQSGQAPFATPPIVIGGRYGLSSKEFTPAMVKAVFDELLKDNRRTHFTVGINRRCHLQQPGCGPGVPRGGRGRHPRRVLRPGGRRHRGGQQELHQDHRREHAQLRPGLFRLRFEEVRLDDHQPLAFRPPGDPQALADRQRRFCGLPPAPVPGIHRHAGPGGPRGRVPAEHPLAGGPGLEPPAPARAAAT
jgi:pyruvate-ferredoxin/flavodoxin oxidoreductase